MSDPFNSEYVSATVTGKSAPATAGVSASQVAAAQTATAVSAAEPKAYGFEPERYGLGKPRRIVVRGKIAIE